MLQVLPVGLIAIMISVFSSITKVFTADGVRSVQHSMFTIREAKNGTA